MGFEWDETKNQSNKVKHGIGFDWAAMLFSDPNGVTIPGISIQEPRSTLIASLNGKIWAASYTLRGDNIRIISIRRARKNEEELYG